MTPLHPDMASGQDVLPGEMTATNGNAEMPHHDVTLPGEVLPSTAIGVNAGLLEDEPREPEHDRTVEFEQHTAHARELSRKGSNTGEATPSRNQSVSQERRSEAQNEGEDLTESKPEAMSSRTQAAWVNEAVAACQANKKVRFLVVGYSIQDKH